MKYVYIIQSKINAKEYYVGITNDVGDRLKAHNNGQSPHTAKFKPWKLITYTAFVDNDKAVKFEKYLKSGSGRVFAKRHFR